jgi:DNA-binding beta-propeller fold protein YncE
LALWIIGGGLSGLAEHPLGQSDPIPRPVATIPLPKVSGRIDHLGFDAAHGRLFVAALENNTVEVVDAVQHRHLRSLAGFREPQGVAVAAEANAVAIANGDTGTLQLIDAETFEIKWTVKIGGDADNVRYDALAKRLLVAAQGGLYAVDPTSGRALGRIAISGHPESFQLESQGSRVFANLPGVLSNVIGGGQIVAADRTTMTATARWSACGANYPMALDEAGRRLFIGCRHPASIAMVDTVTGKNVASVPAVSDTDDLFYDAERRRLYVIGGEGGIDVFARDGDTLRPLSRIATRGGARTGLWVAAQRRLYVAVPARSGQSAELRVFEAP